MASITALTLSASQRCDTRLAQVGTSLLIYGSGSGQGQNGQGRRQDFISTEAKGQRGRQFALVRRRMVGRGTWRARDREPILGFGGKAHSGGPGGGAPVGSGHEGP